MSIFFVFSDRATYSDLFDSDLTLRIGVQPDDPDALINWASDAGATASFELVPFAQVSRGPALLSGRIDIVAITYQESARRIAEISDDFTFMDQDGNVLSKEKPSDWVTTGTSGDDNFVGTDEDQRIDGEDGEDVMFFGSPWSNFDVTLKDDSSIVVVKPNGTTAELTSIERLEFYGSDLIFDISSDNAAPVYRLYGGAFDRAPDEAGLRYWIDAVDAGLSLRDAAAAFLASPEFQRLYHYSDGVLSNEDFVEAIYFNVLGRGGEREGIDFWTDYLDSGGDQAEVLVQFTQLPEYVGLSEAYTSNGYLVV